MAGSDLPSDIELTPFDEAYRNNPYPNLARLREGAPFYRDEQFKRVHVSKAKDVARILRDRELLTDPRKANEDAYIRMLFYDQGGATNEPSMLLADDPDHKRLRGLVNKAFTPRAVEAMRPRAREIAEELIDDIHEDEFDFMEKIAGPYPTIVIAEMLGVDTDRRHDFKAWSDASNDAFFDVMRSAETLAAGANAEAELDRLFRAEIAKRRALPTDDLIGAMVAAEEAGDMLTEDEIVQQCNLLLIAGNITTTDLIGNGMKALLDNPEQFDLLKADPSLVPQAVEEMLRYDSPVTYSARIAERDRTEDGCPIHKGESIYTALAAANHDPDQFENPERFDIMREDKRHQSFGGGRHFCLGAPLARLEAQELFAVLIEQMPNIRPVGVAPIYRAIPSFRGMREYRVQIG